MKKNNNGYALLILLLGIVIIAILYMVDLSAMFGLGKATNPDIYAERPWFEEQRLVGNDKLPIRQTGKKGKVVIRDKTVLNGQVALQSDNRGTVEITIDPNGKAYGHWQCAYEYTESAYTITADFAGNIDPTKIYKDKNGTNKKLLYFITKGKYEQIKTDKKTGKQLSTKQPIYVVGWIDKDYSAGGKLFLMADSDPENHGNLEYDWQTIAGEIKDAGKN